MLQQERSGVGKGKWDRFTDIQWSYWNNDTAYLSNLTCIHKSMKIHVVSLGLQIRYLILLLYYSLVIIRSVPDGA